MSYSFGGISFICSRGDYMSIYIYNLKKKRFIGNGNYLDGVGIWVICIWL